MNDQSHGSVRPSLASVPLALTALAAAGGWLGPLSVDLSQLVAASCLLLLTVAFWLCGGLRPTSRTLLALPVAWWLTRPLEPAALLAIASLWLLALAWKTHDRRLFAAGQAGAVLACCQAIVEHNGSAWVAAQRAVLGLTSLAGELSGAGTELGPSVAGVGPVMLVLGYLVARGLQGRARRIPAAIAIATTLLATAFAWTVGIPVLLHGFNRIWSTFSVLADPGRVPGYPSSVAVYLPAALLAVLFLPLWFFEAGGRERTAPLAKGPAGWRDAPRWLLPAAIVAGLCIGLPQLRLPASGEGRRVVYMTGGMSSWDVPQPMELGLDRLGMFGLMHRYLRAARFEVAFTHDPAQSGELRAGDTLVVTNPTAEFTPAQLDAIDRHVDDGGSLLVLGDHTDLNGTMGPLNQLVAPYGISYRFDSAFTPGHWERNAGFRQGPLTRGLDDANHRFRQSTGAGFDLGLGVDPIATARWGFSDWGDRENVGNAFLGDYIYQASELLGDLPVVAAAEAGRGRVIAFGDTSAFQNVAIAYSWPFISRVFQLAAGKPVVGAGLLQGLGLLSLVVLTAVALNRGNAVTLGLVLAGLALALTLAPRVQRLAEPELRLDPSRVAWIDMAHLNHVSPDIWADAGLTGLAANLARNGYLALIDRQGDPRRWVGSGVYVTVAPRHAFGKRQREALGRMVAGGGHLIVATGWEERSGAELLLADYGLAIAPVPLGPVPVLKKIDDPELYQYLQTLPHFAEAWPVDGVLPETDATLYETAGYPVVIQRRQGPGRLTVIGDSMFLLNKTLEEEGAAWVGNVVFLRQLLQGEPRPRQASSR